MRAELQLGLEIGAPRRMVPFLSAKSRIAWYNFLMIRFLNARNRLYYCSTTVLPPVVRVPVPVPLPGDGQHATSAWRTLCHAACPCVVRLPVA